MKSILLSVLLILFFSVIAWSNGMSNSDDTAELPSKDIQSAKAEANTRLPIFEENSITRDYLNSLTGLEWQNKLGDWVDLNGTPQGKVPWASADVDPATQGPIVLDVTTLVSAQRGKKDQLMVLSATNSVDVWSREGLQGPKIKITLMDDSLIELSPELDCFISTSTYKNINSDTLKFDNSVFKAFIQFKIPRKEFKSAILELSPIKVHGSGQVQVFDLASQSGMFNVREGIASGLSSYAALKGNPEVIFVDTFDEPEFKPEWFMQGTLRSEQIRNGFLTGEIDPKLKGHAAVNFRYYFDKHIKEEPTESYFRYSVRFHEDFLYATDNGKLPGQAGTYNRCGWGGRKPSKACQGWSARMHWKRPINAGPYKDLIPIGTYLYNLGQEGKYGDTVMWQAFCQLGQWCELEQYVKLNTPGKDDGILRGYHNGELVLERKDIRFRDNENVRIEDVWVSIYHGGMGYPTEPIHADIDNVIIARTYIGTPGKAKIGVRNDVDKTSLAEHTQTAPYSSTLPYRQLESYNGINPVLSIPTKVAKDTRPTWHQNPLLTKLADNTTIDLGNFTCTVPEGDANSCTNVTDYSGMVYDQNHHQILMFGGGHATTFTDTVFIFNFETLSWREDYSPTPCTNRYMYEANYDPSLSAWKNGPVGPYPRPISTHSYDLLAVATGQPEFVMLKGGTGESRTCPPDPPRGYFYSNPGKVAHYQLKTKTWKFSDTTRGDEAGPFSASEYDPVSGMILLIGRKGLYIYDPVRRTNMRVRKQFLELTYANELVYYPPNDRLYYFDRKKRNVWELTLDRNNLKKSILQRLSVNGTYPEHLEPGYAYDKANGIIGGAVHDNKFYIFDPRTRTWSSQVISRGKPGSMEFHTIVYDPVDNVFVFLTKGFKTWAYRYKS